MPTAHRNRLANETSPYLLQHAGNPVDWYPWGPEAFERARHDDKPVLLSVGYSACHWCHVMEEESFEDEETARVLNQHFVAVKVDREERPDIDEIYMSCVQLLTGRGGWPMTVFLTPQGEPFYGGTYYPPEDRHGLPAFRKVLLAVAEAYRERRSDVIDTTRRLVAALEKVDPAKDGDAPLDATLVVRAAETLLRACDRDHGGFGHAPKFPNTMVLSMFLRATQACGRASFAEHVALTVRQMAAGGIYDQIGGGFHRYSVDERWLVPHFEKMLYDNSQLASLCLETCRATGDEAFLGIAEDILRYVSREMLGPGGGFYATQDADSEGVEGKFFLWDRAEVMEVLGADAGEIFCRVFDVTEVGNFESRNILHRTLTDEQAGRMFRVDPAAISRILADGRRNLFEARERRVRPFRDEKILTSWNGLMISAYADAFRMTGTRDYLDVCHRALDFIAERLTKGGRLLHGTKDGVARVPAFLDDYAAVGLAMLDVFDASFEISRLGEAERIGRELIGLFWDEADGGFYFTAKDHEKLVTRTKPAYDGSVPSGNSLAAHLMLRLHSLTGEPEYRDKAERVLRRHHAAMSENPFAHANLIAALDFHARQPAEIAIVAPGEIGAAASLLDPLRRLYWPNRTVFGYDSSRPPEGMPPFAKEKPVVQGRPTAYVCHRGTCSAPVTEWSELRQTIEELR